MVYGPIAAMLVEMFPTRIRYTSMSCRTTSATAGSAACCRPPRSPSSPQTGNIYYGLWYPIIIAGDDLRHRHAVRPRDQGRRHLRRRPLGRRRALRHGAGAQAPALSSCRGAKAPGTCCHAQAEQRLVLLAQQVLLHLAHRVARQFVDDEHALGHLEVGDLRLQRARSARRRRARRRRCATTTATTRLAEVGVRHADHGAFGDAGHVVEKPSTSAG